MSQNQKGAALLTVLWLTVILTFIAGALASTVRTEVAATTNLVDQERGYFLARGAMQAAALDLTTAPANPEEAGKQFARRELQYQFETGTARVELIPESAKFNLNTAAPLTLVRLFLNLGVPEAQARDLVRGIRERTNITKLPYQSLEELLEVPGMTLDLYYGGFRDGARRSALNEVLTVRTPGGAVNVNYAPHEVLASLAGMTPETARALEAARARRPFRAVEELQAAVPSLRLEEPIALGAAGVSGEILTLRAYGRARDAQLERVITAVVVLDTKEPSKMRILEWKE